MNRVGRKLGEVGEKTEGKLVGLNDGKNKNWDEMTGEENIGVDTNVTVVNALFCFAPRSVKVLTKDPTTADSTNKKDC
jgi:hypothetical protein